MTDAGKKLEFSWWWSREMREKSVGGGSTESKHYENAIRKPAVWDAN